MLVNKNFSGILITCKSFGYKTYKIGIRRFVCFKRRKQKINPTILLGNLHLNNVNCFIANTTVENMCLLEWIGFVL